MKKININTAWTFTKEKSSETVNLPHTWNGLDGQTGGNNYYRGICQYEKKLKADFTEGQRVYVEFEGANSVATVLVNGQEAGVHKGGYSTFRYNITSFIKSGEEFDLEVRVDNGHDETIYPLMADFTFMGGLYRDASLLIVNPVHFNLDDCGSDGVSIHQEVVSRERAELRIDSPVTAPEGTNWEVRMRLVDHAGSVVTEASGSAGELRMTVDFPRLWSGVADPYLYTLEADLLVDGMVSDIRRIPTGLRSIAADPARGIILNGEALDLRGVSRHQDRKDTGWALSHEDMEEDMALMQEMGVTSVRLAHYQHNQYFYDLCDRTGIIAWAEIPYISMHSADDPTGENAMSQMEELVKQNINHASILMWGVQNEITIGGSDDVIVDTVTRLNDLTRSLDPSRLTAQAHVGHHPDEDPMNSITDILGYNKYYGWYYDDTNAMGVWLDKFHRENPGITLGITEYGCEAVLDYHNDNPKMGDYSEEYQTRYHHEILKIFNERPWLWATYVWNMFDFASDIRDEGGVQGMNNKGLVTHDRKTKKDSFYIYKSYWGREDVLHICSKRYEKRVKGKTEIAVITNLKEVELTVNGKSLGTVQAVDNMARFTVKLGKGANTVIARSGMLSDSALFTGVSKPEASYICTSTKTNPMGEVQNWFESDSEAGEVPAMEFPEGFFSVQDRISAILKHPEGETVLKKHMAPLFEHAMFGMVKTFSLEKLAGMSQGTISEGVLYKINCDLIKLKK